MARIPLPKRVHGSREVNEAQDAIGETLRLMSYHEPLTGRHIQSLAVTSTGTVIAHGLGRTPIGWHLADLRDAGHVTRTAWDGKTLTLASSAGTLRCDIFVW